MRSNNCTYLILGDYVPSVSHNYARKSPLQQRDTKYTDPGALVLDSWQITIFPGETVPRGAGWGDSLNWPNRGRPAEFLGPRNTSSLDDFSFRTLYIEDITWPLGDTKFLFECWKRFHEWAQRTSEIFFQREKSNFVSLSGHVMFYLLYKHQWVTKPFHFNRFLV